MEINISRGIRQGCPLSALLFIIVAEVLAIKIRTCKEIKGISVKRNSNIKHLKISQLADDTTLFLKNISEVPLIINKVEEFGLYSGLKLNKSKTKGLWIGKLKNNKSDREYEIQFTNTHVKALGVIFGNNRKECDKLNWDHKILECQSILSKWNKRNLTFYGRILTIKSIVLPKLIYLIQNLDIPKSVINQINSFFFKFLWKAQNDKI